MKTARTKWRQAFRWFLSAFALAGFAIALLPVWFPWALRPVLGHYGLQFGGYERHGFSRFALTDVQGGWQQTRFEARHIECVLPAAWLWQRLFPNPNAAPTLTINDWRLTMPPRDKASAPSGDPSMSATLDEVVAIITRIDQAVTSAHLSNGLILDNSWSFAVPVAEWQRGQLTTELQPPWFNRPIRIGAALDDGSQIISLNGEVAAWNTALQAKLRREPAGWQLSGQLAWLTNRAELSAKFAATGWWPESAQLGGQQLRVPSTLFRLRGYDDLTAALTLNLVSNRFELQAGVTAQPSVPPAGDGLPPFEATLHIAGNPDSVTVKRLEIHTPGLMAEMTNDFGIWRDGNLLTNPAQVQISLDLAKLPGAGMAGKVDGTIRVELTDTPRAVARFEIFGTNLLVGGFAANRIAAAGVFDWPMLKLDQLAIHFDDHSALSLSGASDLPARRITEARWELSGNLPAQFVATNRIGTVEASGRFSGPFNQLTHSGQIIMAKAQFQPWAAVDVRADWQGTNLHLAAARIELSAGGSALSLAGKMAVDAGQPTNVRVELTEAFFKRDRETLYTLAAPGVIEFQTISNAPQSWRLGLTSLDWTGDGRAASLAADLHWPTHGSFHASARQFQFADFAGFIPAALTNVSLAQLGLVGNWSNGPIRSELDFTGAVRMVDARVLDVSGSARTGKAIELHHLTLETHSAPALTAAGTIPVSFQPGTTNGWWVVDQQSPLAVRADLKTSENFAVSLGESGEIRISRSNGRIVAGGTLAEPSAAVDAEIGVLEWQTGTNVALRPRLEDFQLHATLHPKRLELRELKAKIDGQPLDAQGEWPVDAAFWKTIWQAPSSLDWSQARGRFSIQDAQVSALAHYLPAVLAPEGRLSANLTLEPGKKIAGLISVTNAVTRPLGKVSPLRDIAARVRFTGTQAALEEFHGHIGGQPVRADGTLNRSAGGNWEYQLRLSGSNVPIARTVGFLLRGAFDLNLKGSLDSSTLVSGNVILQDGLYVQPATTMMLSRPERPGLRPPYFSLTNQPFADWKVDLNIRGDRFLRVRMPVFNGLGSANLKMRGTLGEPVLTGDARINSGRAIFPFGTLRVDQAFATLDGNNPRGPDLLIQASGRNYNYDLRLEVTGPADGATVMFSSTPPLSSEEILLLLTTGEQPRGKEIFSTQARAGRLATFLGKDFLSRYSGDDMAGERLMINTGEDLTEDGQTTYSVEYRLTDRWSLVGDYDRFSAINASIKWKIFSR